MTPSFSQVPFVNRYCCVFAMLTDGRTFCSSHGQYVGPNNQYSEGMPCCAIGKLEIVAERLCYCMTEIQSEVRKALDAMPVSEAGAGVIASNLQAIGGQLNALSSQVVCVQQTLDAHGSKLNEHESELEDLNKDMEFE